VKPRRLDDEEIPYFSWDRRWTVAEIRQRLASRSGAAWNRIAAWVLREAAFADVWQFLTPRQVWERLGDLEPLLGRKREFWKYILGTWRELGKV
jgi:hypothetical protein